MASGMRFENLITECGGAYSVGELAQLLDKTPSKIISMARHRQLIAFTLNNQWLFPVAQFIRGKLIDGVRDVLRAFPKDSDDITISLFFLSDYEGTQKTPLMLLSQRKVALDILIHSVLTLYEHMAR